MQQNVIEFLIGVLHVGEQDMLSPKTDSGRNTDLRGIGNRNPLPALAIGMQTVQHTDKLAFLCAIHRFRRTDQMLKGQVALEKPYREYDGNGNADKCQNFQKRDLEKTEIQLIQAEKTVESCIDHAVRNDLCEGKFHREQEPYNTSEINKENRCNAKMPDKANILLQKSEDTEEKTAP